ncbi:MAG: hypothetical protein QW500_01320 [Candidatus Micrarchaeia archaeon]
MSSINEIGKVRVSPMNSLLLRGKSPFQEAFEKGNIKCIVEELKQLPGTPANKFNMLLVLSTSTGKYELAKKVGVAAYDILSKKDIARLLSYQNGPSEKIALFVEIMRTRYGTLGPSQQIYLFNALKQYYNQYKISGNSLPKEWLSLCIEDIYKYSKFSAIHMYLKMYSTKAPSIYERNVASFIAELIRKNTKLLSTLAHGSYCRVNVQYEALHALNLVSPEQARMFAHVLLERQFRNNVFYDMRVIELAKAVLGE